MADDINNIDDMGANAELETNLGINDAIDSPIRISDLRTGSVKTRFDDTYTFPNQEDYRSEGVAPIRWLDQDWARAKAQDGWDQALGFANQAVVGEIVGGSLEGFGSIYQIFQDTITEAKGGDAEFNNWLIEVGAGLREWTQEATPVYREHPNQSFDVDDPAWWWQNATSIASSFGLMIPGMAAVKGVSWLGKVAKIGGNIGKSTKALIGAGGMASVMRNGENFKEALQVSDSIHNELKDKFKTSEDFNNYLLTDEGKQVAQTLRENDRAVTPEEVSSYIASQAGWRSYKTNASNVVFDFVQVLPMFKFGNFLTRANPVKPHPKGLLGAQAKQVGKVAKQKPGMFKSAAGMVKAYSRPGTIAFETGTEGIEEIINSIGNKEGLRYGHQLMDEMSNSESGNIMSRLGDYLSDGHTWEQAFWGAMGGLTFAGGARAIGAVNGVESKKQKEAKGKAEIDQRAHVATLLNTLVDSYIKADTQEFDPGTGVKQDMSVEDIIKETNQTKDEFLEGQARQIANLVSEALSTNAIDAGTVDLLIQDLEEGKLGEAVDKLSNSEELPDNVKKHFTKQNLIRQIKSREDTYNKNYNSLMGRYYKADWIRSVALGKANKASNSIINARETISYLDGLIAEETTTEELKKNQANDPNLVNRANRFGLIQVLDKYESGLSEARQRGDDIAIARFEHLIKGVNKDIKESIAQEVEDPIKADAMFNRIQGEANYANEETAKLQTKGYGLTTLQKITDREYARQEIIGSQFDLGQAYDVKASNKVAEETIKVVKDDISNNKKAITKYFDDITDAETLGTDIAKHVEKLKETSINGENSVSKVDTITNADLIVKEFDKAAKRLADNAKVKETVEKVEDVDPLTKIYWDDDGTLLASVKDEVFAGIIDKLNRKIELTEFEQEVYSKYTDVIDAKVSKPVNNTITAINESNSIDDNFRIMFNLLPKTTLNDILKAVYNGRRPTEVTYGTLIGSLVRAYIRTKRSDDASNPDIQAKRELDKAIVERIESDRPMANILSDIDKLAKSGEIDIIPELTGLLKEYMIRNYDVETMFEPELTLTSTKGNKLYSVISNERATAKDDANVKLYNEIYDNDSSVAAISDMAYLADRLINVHDVEVYEYGKSSGNATDLHADLIKLYKKAKDKQLSGERLDAESGEYRAIEFVDTIHKLLNKDVNNIDSYLELRLATAQPIANKRYIYYGGGLENTNMSATTDDGKYRETYYYTEEEIQTVLGDLRFRLLNNSRKNSNIFIADSSRYEATSEVIDELKDSVNIAYERSMSGKGGANYKLIKSMLAAEYYELLEDKAAETNVLRPAFTKIIRNAADIESLKTNLDSWYDRLKENSYNIGNISKLIEQQLRNNVPINKIAINNVRIARKNHARPNYIHGVENNLLNIFPDATIEDIIIVGKNNVHNVHSRANAELGKESIPFYSETAYQQGVYLAHRDTNNGEPMLIRLKTKRLGKSPVVAETYDSIIDNIELIDFASSESIKDIASTIESILSSFTNVKSVNRKLTSGVKTNISKDTKRRTLDIIEVAINTSTSSRAIAADGVSVDNKTARTETYKVVVHESGRVDIIKDDKYNEPLATINSEDETENNDSTFKAELLNIFGKLPTTVNFSKLQSTTKDSDMSELVAGLFDSIITDVQPVKVPYMSKGEIKFKETIYDISATNASRNPSHKLSFDNIAVPDANSAKPVRAVKINKSNIVRSPIDINIPNAVNLLTDARGKDLTVGQLLESAEGVEDSTYSALYNKYKDTKIVEATDDSTGLNALEYDPVNKVIKVLPQFYEANKNGIAMDAMMSMIITHELIHAEINNRSKDELDTIYKELADIKARLLQNPESLFMAAHRLGIKDSELLPLVSDDASVEEFVTLAFTNNRIMTLMANVKMDYKGERSILDKFIDVIVKALKELGVVEDTLLHNVAAVIVNNNIDITGTFNTNSNKGEVTLKNPEASNVNVVTGLKRKARQAKKYFVIPKTNKFELTEEEDENRCTGYRTLKAARGIQDGLGNGKWEVVKDLKGLPSHKDGGVQLSINEGDVSFSRGSSQIHAKCGMVITNKK